MGDHANITAKSTVANGSVLTVEARNKAILDQLDEARRTAHEAAGRGRSTLEELDAQNEILQRTEDTLEANEYVLQKSMRVLRGMTWSGWLYNTFSTDKKPDSTLDVAAAVARVTLGSTSSSSSCSTDPHAKATLIGQQASTITPGGRVGVDIFDHHLEELSSTVAELHGMSLLIGETLEGQKETIDRIDRKTELVHDKTLAVTLKASQITQRTKKMGGNFLGKYQFVDMESGMFLCVDADECLQLTNTPSRSAYFHCYSKADNIVGIQNCKTLSYIGTTWIGGVKAAGRVFGKQEECHVNLRDGQLTGLFLLSKNWGGGGWLKKTPATDSSPVYLNSTTSSVIDKQGALVLRTILISKDDDGDIDDESGTTTTNPPSNGNRV